MEGEDKTVRDIRRVWADRRAEVARRRAWKRRRLALGLGVVYCIWVTGALVLMFIIDPPLQGIQVTVFQQVCIAAAIVGGVPGYVALIIPIVGVIGKESRPVMWLPLAINIVLFFIPGIVGLIWHATGAFSR